MAGEQEHLDVGLDNSALSRLVDDALRTDVINAILGGNYRLVVPVLALSECLTQADATKVEPRARAISDLFKRLGDRAILGADMPGLLEAEQQSQSPLKRTRSLPDAEAAEQLEHLSAPDFEARQDHYLQLLKHYLAKNDTYDLDRSARADAEKLGVTITTEGVDAWVDAGLVSTDLVSAFAKKETLQLRILAEPSRYPTTIIVSAYIFLNATGAILAGRGYGNYQHVLRGPQQGSWVDGRTAASCAYCEVFISEDKNQRAKVNFIAERFGLSVRALELRAWLQT